MNIGNKLRGLRTSHDFTPHDMAQRIGVSESTYRRYEQGKAKIDIKVIERIAEIFGIEYNDLLGEDNNTILQTKNENAIAISQNFAEMHNGYSQKFIEQLEARITDLKEEIELLKEVINKIGK